MEMLKKVSRRKKKTDKPAEIDLELESQHISHYPPPEIEVAPLEIRPVPNCPPMDMAQAVDAREEMLEAEALNIFRQRINTYRNSQARYQNPMAPGFDYANWKPYGKVRYRNQQAEFDRMAHNLAPYVACVVESACMGLEERRWAAMTQLHPEEAAAMESLQASRAISRAASRDRLA